MSIRPNWREINVVDLTDEEVDQMSDEEARWCNDLLHERWLLKSAPPQDVIVEQPPQTFTRAQIDAADIAVVDRGRRIWIYPGEGHGEDCFAGELINPTRREMRGQGHISCLWDCSKVVALEGVNAAYTPTPTPSSEPHHDQP